MRLEKRRLDFGTVFCHDIQPFWWKQKKALNGNRKKTILIAIKYITDIQIFLCKNRNGKEVKRKRFYSNKIHVYTNVYTIRGYFQYLYVAYFPSWLFSSTGEAQEGARDWREASGLWESSRGSEKESRGGRNLTSFSLYATTLLFLSIRSLHKSDFNVIF